MFESPFQLIMMYLTVNRQNLAKCQAMSHHLREFYFNDGKNVYNCTNSLRSRAHSLSSFN